MKEITIKVQNRVGALADVAELLGGLGVNIEAISAHGEGDFGIIRIITNDSKTAMKNLAKLPGMKSRESDIIIVDMSNKPGELGKITRKLANKGVDLESIYLVSKLSDVMQVAIKPANESFAKAREVLGIKT